MDKLGAALVLHDLTLPGSSRPLHLSIAQGQIVDADEHGLDSSSTHIHLGGGIVYPGLINSHDHLDFNLFPRLGNRSYASYLDWGADIHKQDAETIREVLSVPKALRAQWGVYKNLLAGVTSVVHHGEPLLMLDSPINVVMDTNNIHSVGREKTWRWKLNNPFASRQAFVVHTGEGVDDNAHHEINQLIRWNLLQRPIVAVHGVAMNKAQAAHFKALVWCPDSNLFLLEKTAEILALKQSTRILFGTDSTVSANWNFWSHLRLARTTNLLSDEELLSSVTTLPAQIWGLRSGAIRNGFDADIIVAKQRAGISGIDHFFSLNPEDLLLVVSKGKIVLFDASLLPQMADVGAYSQVWIAGIGKFVKGKLGALLKEIRQHYPAAIFPVDVE